MKKALIVQGGWDGHEPDKIAALFERWLLDSGFSVTVSDSLSSLDDAEKLKSFDLLVPVWTMAEISNEQAEAVSEAVQFGLGIAGCHGGMCDAFRNAVLWQFITGGNWVSHPGNDGTSYRVDICNSSSPLVDGISSFDIVSEQYYLHVDPAVEVLATTRFPVAEGPHTVNGPVDMPVAWTKYWGQGRIYYNSLGHHADIFNIPEAAEMMKRGLLWAAR